MLCPIALSPYIAYIYTLRMYISPEPPRPLHLTWVLVSHHHQRHLEAGHLLHLPVTGHVTVGIEVW